MNARAASCVRGSALVFGALLTLAGMHYNARAAGNDAHAEAAAHVVTIEALQFQPATLTVHRGDRITWMNKDLFPHTATGPKGTFDSTSIPAGGSWTFVTDKPGTFTYSCAFHTTMKATLTVR